MSKLPIFIIIPLPKTIFTIYITIWRSKHSMPIIESFISLLLIILFSFLFYKWFTIFFPCRFKNHTITILALYVLTCVFLRLLINHNSGQTGIRDSVISSLLELLVLDMLFIIIAFKGSFIPKLLLFLVTTLLLPAIFTTLIGSVNHILKLPNNSYIYENNSYINFFTVHILSYVAILLTEERKRKQRYNTRNLFSPIIFSVIGFQFLMHYYFSYMISLTENGTDYINHQLIYAFSIIIFFCICVMYEKSISVYNHTLEMKHRIEYYELQSKFYEDSTQSLIQHRKMRHDYKNHLCTIQGYIETKMFDEANIYINDLLTIPSEFTKIIDNKNPTLSAILTCKNRECQEHGIPFHYRLNYENLQIAPVDLTIIIGNLLDNAIEACLKLDSDQKKEIRFTLQEQKGTLVILCANPYQTLPKTKGKLFLTSKDDQQSHGLGLGNVEDVLFKYDGNMEITTERGMFVISLFLQNHAPMA